VVKPAAHARRTRQSERGAAVFIVVMAITLLTAIGVFAIRSASMVEMASGYNRQAVQAMYLSEFGGRAAAGHTSAIGDKLPYLFEKDKADKKCVANAGASLKCLRFYAPDLEKMVDSEYPGQLLLEPQDVSGEGSLGPPVGEAGLVAATDGTFMIEVTDPGRSEPIPGQPAGNAAIKNTQVTVTVFAQVRPFPDGGASGNPWCTASTSSTGASIQSLRSHFTIKNTP
jgi:hypothetical protein